VEIVEFAADLSELALLEQQRGVRLGELTARSVELLEPLAVAAHEVPDGPAGGEADESREQGAEQDCRGVFMRTSP